MTLPNFTPDGIQVQTFQEIYDELAAGYRSIYGEDINLDPDSPDGQRVAIEAQLVLDAQSFGALEYNQRDPDFALGQSLNSIIKLAGISRRPATRSQVDVEVTTGRPLTLPEDYAVEDDLGQSWTTLNAIDIPPGETTVTLFAEDFGAVEAGPATVDFIISRRCSTVSFASEGDWSISSETFSMIVFLVQVNLGYAPILVRIL